MMSIVFKLPIDIVREILSHWIDLISISKLDRCISGLYTRRAFLDLISSPPFIFNGSEVGAKVDSDYYRWLFNRNLSVQVITVGSRNHTIGCYLQRKVCSHLKRLDFSAGQDVSGLNLTEVFLKCPNLEEILFTERNIDHVMHKEALLSLSIHCPKLRSIELSNNRIINGNIIESIVKGCTQLRELSFNYCYGIDDIALQAIAQHCPHLLHFSCKASDMITEIGITAIAMSCWELSSLHITACCRVSTASVSLLCSNCPLLENLSLSAVLITDAVLGVIAQHCAILQRLEVTRCSLITTPAVIDLVEKCRCLNYLDIRYCHRVEGKLVCDKIQRLTERSAPIQCITLDSDILTMHYFGQ